MLLATEDSLIPSSSHYRLARLQNRHRPPEMSQFRQEFRCWLVNRAVAPHRLPGGRGCLQLRLHTGDPVAK